MTDADNSATRQIAALGGRGWRWIEESVSALISDLSASGEAGTQWLSLALVGQDGSRLLARRRGGVEQLADVAPGAAALAEAVKTHLKKSEQRDLILRFGGGRAIVQRLVLPAGARPVLAAVIRNKIEGLAPWPLEDCTWGYVAHADQGTALAVSVGILGRKTLQAHLAALAAAGVRPAEVDIDEEGGPAIVIDHSSDARRARVSAAFRWLGGLAAAAIVGVGLYGGWLAFRDYSELSAIAARTADLTQALTRRPGTGNLPPQQAAANALAERKQTERPLVMVLNDLTREVPDGSWLTGLDYAGGQVTLQGRGGPAPELLQALEQSDAFAAANFAAATQHDEETDSDVFAIAATVEPLGAKP